MLRARTALEYHLGGWTGRGMLPLLLFEMHARLAAGPIVTPPPQRAVAALYNDVETERDYSRGAARGEAPTI